MAEFISTYRGIDYKIAGTSDKHAKFNNGRLSTKDEQVISYLRKHPDYGATLTEIENPDRKGITVGVHFCPADGCDRVFKTEQALKGHMRVHGGAAGANIQEGNDA